VIRIGFDARWLNDSGVGSYVASLLEAFGQLEDEDFEVVVYESATNPVPVDSPRLKKQVIKASKYSPAEQVELVYRCQRDEIDVFHAPFYLVPILAPCPVISTIHDLMAFLFPLYGFTHQKIVRAGYRVAAWKSHRIIAVSQRTLEDMVSILHVPREKIRRVYNGYSKAMYHANRDAGERGYLRDRYGITEPYALTLSASNWRTKNLDGAMRALALAERESCMPFQSVIAGPKDGYIASGLAGTIKNEIVTGFVPKEDLPKLYRNASAFLSVSRYEGFGIPLVEAMGCGCPAIISTGGSLPEIAGDATPIFGCDDTRGIANEVVRLLTDTEYSDQLRARGFKRSREFSYTKCARETLQLYREAAGEL
jgi:glycosyltransferase involved in cell wall biosynthesis